MTWPASAPACSRPWPRPNPRPGAGATGQLAGTLSPGRRPRRNAAPNFRLDPPAGAWCWLRRTNARGQRPGLTGPVIRPGYGRPVTRPGPDHPRRRPGTRRSSPRRPEEAPPRRELLDQEEPMAPGGVPVPAHLGPAVRRPVVDDLHQQAVGYVDDHDRHGAAVAARTRVQHGVGHQFRGQQGGRLRRRPGQRRDERPGSRHLLGTSPDGQATEDDRCGRHGWLGRSSPAGVCSMPYSSPYHHGCPVRRPGPRPPGPFGTH